jgi:hypothetical protein
VSCGQAHSSTRELVAQGSEAKLVAKTPAIRRSSLYYRRQARTGRADRSCDQEIITACGEKPAYGYRRVVWWLGRHHGNGRYNGVGVCTGWDILALRCIVKYCDTRRGTGPQISHASFG